MINLSQHDYYLSIPNFSKGEIVKKKTISNVFSRWITDSSEDISKIIGNDYDGDFDASLFMKDPNDVQNAMDILKNNFKII